jgi:hypothetical protein
LIVASCVGASKSVERLSYFSRKREVARDVKVVDVDTVKVHDWVDTKGRSSFEVKYE